MSFKLMVQAFEARVGNPLRKLVLIKLADQANDNGVCWPSYETLAFHCETTRRSVITHVKQLEADGFLRIERVYDKEAGKNKSNRYHLTIEKKVLSDGENNSLVKELHHPSENISPPLVKELHPNLSLNLSILNLSMNRLLRLMNFGKRTTKRLIELSA